jgi:Skp family chaperone for outer membrane proteins
MVLLDSSRKRTSERYMTILEKVIRFGAIAVAVLFIGLSLVGIFGAWFVDRKATDVALKGFALIDTGVQVVDAGVGRVNELVATSRTEVRQASETIAAVGPQARANSAVLNALNDRLETSLAPRIEQIQKVLAPVREALGNVANAVSFLNSLPMMADRAPRLAALDDAFNRLEELSADGKQLRGTLRELVSSQNSDITAETLATLNGLTQRIDTRLGKVQANVHGMQTDIDALKMRLDTRKSRLLLVFNLVAFVSTLMLVWIVYTQIVVIQHHWSRVRRPVVRSVNNGNQISSTVTPQT